MISWALLLSISFSKTIYANDTIDTTSVLDTNSESRTTIVGRVKSAAKSSIYSAQTWVPLSGALLFSLGGFDLKFSNWLTSKTPLFGSENNARSSSENLKNVLYAQAFLFTLFSDNEKSSSSWYFDKGKKILVTGLGLTATLLLTRNMKKQSGRQRPNGIGDDSFPSEHSSTSFALSAVSIRSLDQTNLSRPWKTGLKLSSSILASSVAWARMESGRHYPTDVLVGAALGNLMTTFVYESFIDTRRAPNFSMHLAPTNDGFVSGFTLNF